MEGMHMNRLFILPLVVLLSGCLPGQEPKQIIVEAEASIEVPPDGFSLSVGISSLEETRDSALSKVASIYSEMQTELKLLEGLESLSLETSGVSIEPVRELQCTKDTYDDEACPIVSYRGAISISLKGAPSRLAGNMLSLASELGVSSVSFDEYVINDYAAAKERAVKAAVVAARQEAEIIASAAGATIVGPAKFQIGSGFDDGFFDADRDTIIVTGSRQRSPRIQLDIEPQPIYVDAEITAAFEIE